jgi:hypothetical protein
LLPTGFDHGKMASPEERERRLASARANDAASVYVGDQGAERFHAEDKREVERGIDLPRTLERRTELARARAAAGNATGGGVHALEQTTAVRVEKRNLERELREVDNALVRDQEEAEDTDRRGVSRAREAFGLRGRLLERRHEITTQLEKLAADTTMQLESIPGYALALEQVSTPARTGGGDEHRKLLERVFTAEEVDALQREVDAASAYQEQHPDVDFLKCLEMAHEGTITLDGES